MVDLGPSLSPFQIKTVPVLALAFNCIITGLGLITQIIKSAGLVIKQYRFLMLLTFKLAGF